MAIFSICPKGRILRRQKVCDKRKRLEPITIGLDSTWEMKEPWPLGPFLGSPDNCGPAKLLLFTGKVEVSIVLYLT